MTRLSVNINKVALIRNARGQNQPDLLQFAMDCERFGADGITVHPRPDQRHIRFDDLEPLRKAVTHEFNIEGNPTRDFLDRVLKTKPHQCTLVPDDPNALTSDQGWDTIRNQHLLQEVISELHAHDIRVSIFIDARADLMESAAKTGTDRIELYTGPFAHIFQSNPALAIADYSSAANAALECGLEINAGHDLNLLNLRFFAASIPGLKEVSIGHALVCDALYYGLENTIGMYKRCLELKQ